MMTVLTGLLAGAVHVLSGPDHLAAVAPLSLDRHRHPWAIGLRWGIGHASGVVLVGLFACFFREALMSSWLISWSERLVGIALVAVGLWGLRKALNSRIHAHRHTHEGHPHLHIHAHAPSTAHPVAAPGPHFHTHTALAIGILHGLAGSSHLLGIIPTLAMPTTSQALAYLLSFGAGTVAAMAGFTSLMNLIARQASFHGLRAYRLITLSFSLAAIGIGCFWFLKG